MKKMSSGAKITLGIIVGLISIVGISILFYFLFGKDEFDWLNSMSTDKLNVIREKARKKHCSGDENAMLIMDMIDNQIRKREDIAHGNKEPGYPAHREHGWNLYKDD